MRNESTVSLSRTAALGLVMAGSLLSACKSKSAATDERASGTNAVAPSAGAAGPAGEAPGAAAPAGKCPAGRWSYDYSDQALETLMKNVARSHCGLVFDGAACACNRRVPVAVRLGRVQPNEPQFAEAGSAFAEARNFIRGIEEAKRVIELQRTTHPRGATVDFTRRVVSALDASHG